MTQILLHGASGRMGQEILSLDEPSVHIVAAVARSGQVRGFSGPVYQQSHGITEAIDVVVDFSLPEAFDAVLEWCVSQGVALVSGTTGLNDSQMQAINQAAETIPVLWSPNMSLAVHWLNQLVASTAEVLGNEAEIEITETHHRHKKDAPSGTALMLGRTAAEARGQTFEQVSRLSREGQVGERKAGEIGFSAIRHGEVIGDHAVIFSLGGERISLEHHSSNRSCYARGALKAAQWLQKQPAGRYHMQDVLGNN